MRACAAPTGKRSGAIPKRRTCSSRIGMETPALGRSGLKTGGCLVVVSSGHAGLTRTRCVSPPAVTRPRRRRWRLGGQSGSRDAARRRPRALRGTRSSRRARTMQIECRRCPREDVARFPIGRGCCRMAGGTPGAPRRSGTKTQGNCERESVPPWPSRYWGICRSSGAGHSLRGGSLPFASGGSEAPDFLDEPGSEMYGL